MLLSLVIQRWSRVFLPVAFLHHDFTGALSSPHGWFPGRHLTLPLCEHIPPPSLPPSSCPVILQEAKEKVVVKATPLPSLQPPGSISEMRSDDTRALGEPPLLSLAQAL